MALDSLAVMKSLGAIEAKIDGLFNSQRDQGARIGSLEVSLEKKTSDIYSHINDVERGITERINEHVNRPSNGNGNGNGNGRAKTILTHPAIMYGGPATGGGIIVWLLQHVVFK